MYEPVDEKEDSKSFSIDSGVEQKGGVLPPADELEVEEQQQLRDVPVDPENHPPPQVAALPRVDIERVLQERHLIPILRLYFAYAWRMYCLNSGTMSGVTMLWGVIYFSTCIGSREIVKAAGMSKTSFEGILLVWLIEMVPISLIFMPGVSSGYLAVHRALGNDQAITVENCFGVFRNWDSYRQAVALGLFLHVGMCVTYYPAFVPMIFFLAFTTFSMSILLEHPQFGWFGSVKLSCMLVWKYGWVLVAAYAGLFLFNFLLFIWDVFRVLCLVTIPVGLLTFVVAYHHLIGINGVRRDLFFDVEMEQVPAEAEMQEMHLPEGEEEEIEDEDEGRAGMEEGRNEDGMYGSRNVEIDAKG
uniref:Transmembrane protein n=1 Tax=Lotharella oceanica TaxID=641309 RepID=A0A7S2TL63_9EUKA|mmetsp:Transcript_16787/g.31809  ORF Transcript_16787/g.31809 Transcript_16787/m.31809 type:complete len:358 (+) Transcript_16787:43-1116(+)